MVDQHVNIKRPIEDPWVPGSAQQSSSHDIHPTLLSRRTVKADSPEGVLIRHMHLNWRPVKNIAYTIGVNDSFTVLHFKRQTGVKLRMSWWRDMWRP